MMIDSSASPPAKRRAKGSKGKEPVEDVDEEGAGIAEAEGPSKKGRKRRKRMA